MRRRFTMKDTKSITDERLKEIAAIIPSPDDESPEITETETARARFAHESHPEWYRTVPVKQLVDDIFVLDIMRKDMKHDDPRLQSVISK